MDKIPLQRLTIWVFLLSLPLLFSCANTRKATYFHALGDSASFRALQMAEPLIQPNDILSISVSSANEEASRIFNMPNRTEAQNSTPTGELAQPAGYLVTSEGEIRFPMLGIVKAGGLNKRQLQESIRSSLASRKLLVEPVVEVRHLNFKVSVLGEVARPTVVTVPSEKITLLEALSLAGDVTIFGKRQNVLVIREEEGRRITQRIDLTSNELFLSSYYYLKPNDIVYVEPNKARVATASRSFQILPIIISALTATVIIFDRLAR